VRRLAAQERRQEGHDEPNQEQARTRRRDGQQACEEPEERIERVIRRSKLTREEVLDRIRQQMDDDSREKMSDYIVRNSENDMIIPAVLKIHEDILKHI
jgi:F0F1-type ATP synthase membrane subunit b/b'